MFRNAMMAALVLCAATAAHAKTAAPAAGTPPSAAHPLTAEDLGAWLDGLIPYSLARADVAGAEVAVVKDGQVLFEKGYGVSDVKTRAKVDPDVTLFRPGSISKLFTWTAAMQLVEQHKLDLDADINRYLDFQIPPAYGKPITLRDLMTHTPGFEETIKGLFSNKREPLRTVLARWVPERMYPPGEVSAYSNYGAALAGYIVQRVSGEKYEDYIARHIFAPLKMDHSTFVQPLPKALAPDMSKGYATASDKEIPFENINMVPAGALSTTAGDIARFMMAHLNDGTYDGGTILKPEMARLMHSLIYTPVPGAQSMGLGFYHDDCNGHDVVAHAGDTLAFHSDLHLILDENVGLYYTQNSMGKPQSMVRGFLYRAFMDRYFPAPAATPEPTLKTAKADAARVAGTYDQSRRSDSSFMRIAELFGQMKVTANDDGTLSVDALVDPAGNPYKWREVAPNRWRQVNGDGTLIVTWKDGKIARLDTDQFPPIIVISPAPFWRLGTWNLPLLIGTFAFLLLVVLFWPIKAILRWRYDSAFPLSGRAAVLYRLSRVEALIDLVFLSGWAAFLTYGSANVQAMDSAFDPVVRGLQVVGLIGIAGTVIPIYQVVSEWRSSQPWWTKITDILLAVACLSVVWFIVSLKLITVGLNY